MDNQFWPAMSVIIPSFFTGLMTVVLAYLSYRTKSAVEKAGLEATKAATEASMEAQKVSDQLKVTDNAVDIKLTDLKKVTTDTHTLVNSNMEKALMISAVALRRVANMTKEGGDIKAAELAEEALAEHRKKQVKVDAAVAKREEQETNAPISQQRTLGEVTRETMTDVKEVKRDVKTLKKDTE